MIAVREGQFCVVVSSYGSFRVVRADKVTPKQIRTIRYRDRYDVEPRDRVLFAGTDEEARALQFKAEAIRSLRMECERAARKRRDEACKPFEAAYSDECEQLQKRARYDLLALFAEQVSA
jgi:hypothetical protein